MKVKICGITRVSDAQLAERLGADFIGVIFAQKSPRCVDLPTAGEIGASLTSAGLVGVFVEQDVAQVEEIAHCVGLAAVQLYRPPTRRPMDVDYIQAIRVRDRNSFEAMDSLTPDYFLVDHYDENVMGGTGQSFDWSLLPSRLDKVFLSGGISEANARRACELKPYALDVCSSVEREPGIKDPAKLERFFEEVRR